MHTQFVYRCLQAIALSFNRLNFSKLVSDKYCELWRVFKKNIATFIIIIFMCGQCRNKSLFQFDNILQKNKVQTVFIEF